MNNPLRVLRPKDMPHKTGMSLPQIRRLTKLGQFPAPIALTPFSTGWYEHEIDEWIRERPRVTNTAASPKNRNPQGRPRKAEQAEG